MMMNTKGIMRLLTTRILSKQKHHQWWINKRKIVTTEQQQNQQKQKQERGVWLQGRPRVCLHDVHTELRTGGLPPNSPVTLTANLTDENGKRFCSHAYFISDEKGEVDLRDATSVGGSYKGLFPAGLLATLSSEPYEKCPVRLYRRNPQIPWKITVSVTAGHTDITTQQETLAKVELERHLMAPGVQRLPVKIGRVRGTLYLPPGPGPFPGIVDMFGSHGGLLEYRSAMLASRGFCSLALALFNYDDLPETYEKLDFDYFEEAMQFLLSHPKVIPDRCGTISVSKSGDIAFNMGILFEPVKAVVGINALTFPLDTEFYYKGKPYVKGIDFPLEKAKFDQHGLHLNLGYLFDNDQPHMIPVEKADDDTHFLIACGEDDAWGFKHSIPPFHERMQRSNKNNVVSVVYPGAGHIIQPPYDPLVYNSLQRKLPGSEKYGGLEDGLLMKWGGHPQETCNAQVDLWKRMQAFLMKHIRDESTWFQKYLHTSSQGTTTKLEN